MTTLTEFTAALTETLEEVEGIRRAHTWDLSSPMVFPALFLHPPTIEYTNLAAEGIELSLDVNLFMAAVMGGGHAELLSHQDLTGAASVVGALQLNRNLGLAGVDCRVRRTRPLTLTEVQAYNAYGCTFEISARIG